MPRESTINIQSISEASTFVAKRILLPPSSFDTGGAEEASPEQKTRPAIARLAKFHAEAWKEACRQLVVEDMGLRRQLS